MLRFTDLTRDQLDAVIDVRNRSFGMGATGDDWRRAAGVLIDGRRLVGVLDDDHDGMVVGAARLLDFRHWWLGRPVPMAGIAGVVVAPEYRGRGVGSTLMRGVLARAHELGSPLTALYPATLPIYRHLGYEFGGGRYRFSFVTSELRTLGGREVRLRKGGPADAELLLDLVAGIRAANRESGMLIWPVDEIREWLTEPAMFCYIADDGFVVYTWQDGDLRVDELVAGSEPTLRALWSVVGSGSSIARSVHAYVGPQDPIHQLLDKEADLRADVQRWMLRLVDAPAAIAARGWAHGVSLDLPLEIEDPELTHNDGSWSLRVTTDKAELVRAEPVPGALRVTARGLACLYSGSPLATVRRTGQATGGSVADDARLDAAFAGPVPYMLDYF